MTIKVCNICGGTAFGPGPGKRLSDTGQLPRCASCQSLEWHRTLREMYTRIKVLLPLHRYSALQIGDYEALPASWVGSMTVSVFGEESTMALQGSQVSAERYDLVLCNNLLERVENDRQVLQDLEKTLRQDGFIQIGALDPLSRTVTDDWGYPKREDHGHFRVYGMDILSLLEEAFQGYYLLLVRLADPVTLVESLYFLVTRSKRTADQLLQVFPGASQQLLKGDGQPDLLGAEAVPLPALERIAFDSGKFRRSRFYRNYVLAKGHSQVQGWVTDGALTALSCLAVMQDELGIGGPACEIGVHHGRFFLFLASVTTPEEKCLAIDVFEDQEANIDKSGNGDYAAFTTNVENWLDDASRVKVLKGDSLKISAVDITNSLDGQPIRLFSIDGGHTVKHVLNDLELSEQTLVSGGIAIVDDFYNPHWPGVVEGVFRYSQHSRPRALFPFAYGDNKLYLTQETHLETFKAFVARRMRSFAIDYKTVELMGRPVHCIRMPAAADLSRRFEPQFVDEPDGPQGKRLGDVEVEEFIGPWNSQENTGRWTGGGRAGIVLKIPTRTGAKHKITGRLAGVATPNRPEVSLDVYVNGVKLAHVIYRQGGMPVDFSINLPAFVVPIKVKVEFASSYTVRPVDIGLSSDARTLGVFITALRVF